MNIFISLVLIIQQTRDSYGVSLNPRPRIFVLHSHVIYTNVSEYIFMHLEHRKYNRDLEKFLNLSKP